MTIYGWDASHWDAPPAVRDGISWYTHKVAEGHRFYKDAEYSQSLNAARALGVPVLGSYFVNHPGTVADQADWWVSIVNAETPWWRDVPWIWQIDAEKFSYMDRAPSLSEINALGDAICARTGSPASSVIAYAPKWLYGDNLTGLRYRLWASNYGTNPAAPYRDTYPGDSSSRWGAYSGQTPIILQYGSKTTIAGQTTCDANAYRGTLDQLTALFTGDDMTFEQADRDVAWATTNRAFALLTNAPAANYSIAGKARSEPNAVAAKLAELDASIDAVAAAAGFSLEALAAVKAAAREGAMSALTPEALAAAIPDHLAADVVQLLGERQAEAQRAAADVLDG